MAGKKHYKLRIKADLEAPEMPLVINQKQLVPSMKKFVPSISFLMLNFRNELKIKSILNSFQKQ